MTMVAAGGGVCKGRMFCGIIVWLYSILIRDRTYVIIIFNRPTLKPRVKMTCVLRPGDHSGSAVRLQ